jgi:hypothetical protein
MVPRCLAICNFFDVAISLTSAFRRMADPGVRRPAAIGEACGAAPTSIRGGCRSRAASHRAAVRARFSCCGTVRVRVDGRR